ncbi:unnamed protein product [Ectocarpus fasciculatus]
MVFARSRRCTRSRCLLSPGGPSVGYGPRFRPCAFVRVSSPVSVATARLARLAWARVPLALLCAPSWESARVARAPGPLSFISAGRSAIMGPAPALWVYICDRYRWVARSAPAFGIRVLIQ